MMDDQCLCSCILSFHKFGRGSQLTFLLIMMRREKRIPSTYLLLLLYFLVQVLEIKPFLGKKRVKYAETHTDTLLNILFQASVSVCLVGCLQNFYVKKTRQFVKLFCEFLSEISCLLLKLFSISNTMYIYQLPFNILHSTYYNMYLHNKNILVLYVLIASTIQCLTLQNLPNSNTT